MSGTQFQIPIPFRICIDVWWTWGKERENDMIRAVPSAVLLTADLRDAHRCEFIARSPFRAISEAHHRIVHYDLAVPSNQQSPSLVAFVAAPAVA